MKRLRPPAEEGEREKALEPTGTRGAYDVPEGQFDQSAKALLDQARAAMGQSNFLLAKALFQAIRQMRPRDEYVVQQLALATYKSKQPDPKAALEEAHAILKTLNPENTNDPETLGLWGAVHKRLWELTQERKYLDESIAVYERGFYLKQDFYNGINLAFLLNIRAALEEQSGNIAEAITDFILARRVRHEIVRYCSAIARGPKSEDEKYWILATLWEAAVGLEDDAAVA